MSVRSHGEHELTSAYGRERSRTVTFRVSSGEFESMLQASQAAAARSLSAFARAAVIDHVRAIQAPAVTLSGDLSTLSRALTDIDMALLDASRRIRRVLGSGAAPRVDGPEAGD